MTSQSLGSYLSSCPRARHCHLQTLRFGKMAVPMPSYAALKYDQHIISNHFDNSGDPVLNYKAKRALEIKSLT